MAGVGCGDDRGVSQLVGTVLLIGIVVVLAGVVSTFVTGLGDGTKAPTPSFADSTRYDDGHVANGEYLNVSHRSGETIDIDDVYVSVEGAESVNAANPADRESVTYVGSVLADAGGTALAGDKYLDLGNATVRVVWRDPDSPRTVIIYECAVETPDCASKR